MLLFIIGIIEFISILIFTIYLLYQHAHKDTPLVVKVFTFIGWFMGFSILAILPLDIFIVKPKILIFSDVIRKLDKLRRKN